MIINTVLFWALFTFYWLESKAELNEKFEVKADELMEIMLDGVYKAYPKKNKQIGRMSFKSSTNPQKYFKKTTLLDTTKIKHRDVVVKNMTIEEFKLRRRKTAAKNLLEYEINPSPNFQDSEDEITKQTRRFDKLTRTSYPENSRREYYFPNENATYISGEKNKTIGLMQQFIYETHYMFPYMQIVRKKYIKNVKYQIGFCFALLRNLKQQQLMIYNTLKNYFDLIYTVYAHLQLYQKIVRLDVDIKDVIRLIYALDEKKKTDIKKRKKKKSKKKTTQNSQEEEEEEDEEEESEEGEEKGSAGKGQGK